MKRETPNPAGNKGKPISLEGHTFEDVVRRMLATPAPPKEPKLEKPKRKTAKEKK